MTGAGICDRLSWMDYEMPYPTSVSDVVEKCEELGLVPSEVDLWGDYDGLIHLSYSDPKTKEEYGKT